MYARYDSTSNSDLSRKPRNVGYKPLHLIKAEEKNNSKESLLIPFNTYGTYNLTIRFAMENMKYSETVVLTLKT